MSFMRCLNCLLLVLLFSCSGQVVERDNMGRSSAVKKKEFWGVRKKIAILDFFNESPYGGADLAVNATNELFRELSRTSQFVVDKKFSTVFGTSKEIYSGGGTKLVGISSKAKNIGINFVLYGRVIEAKSRERTDEIGLVRTVKSLSESEVEIRIFDINSNKEIYNKVVKSRVDDSKYAFFKRDQNKNLEYRRNLLRYAVKVAIRKSIPDIVNIASRLDWMGRVAKIIDNKIYFNAGRASGIQIGDILKVMTSGEEIYDIETGATIGVSKGAIKGTIEVIDYIGPDGGVAILHSGGSAQEGDFVKLY